MLSTCGESILAWILARIRADSKPIPPCRSGRVCLWHITNQLIRTSAISQHPTVLRYQIHIEHHDCSVNDDITISFYLFDTAKIVYTSSADHRPLHPESDSFCSFFNFTTATFPGAHNQPIRLLLRAQARSCVFLISFFFSLCAWESRFWERTAFSFCLQLHVMGDFVFCFDYISTWHCISNQRLVPCNPLDTPRHSNLGHSQPSRKLPPRRSHGGPISPHWGGSRPAQSCLQYVTRHQETESDGSHFTFGEVTQAKARNECSPKMGALIWRDVGFVAL